MKENTSNEEQWVELSADMVCAMVSFGDRAFAARDQAHQFEKNKREKRQKVKS